MSNFEVFDPYIGITSIAPIPNKRHGRLVEFVSLASDPFDVVEVVIEAMGRLFLTVLEECIDIGS